MAPIIVPSICPHRFLRCFIFTPILVLVFAAISYAQQMATVTRAAATLHGTPVAAGKVITSLDKGARVEILISQGTWRLVQSQDYVGWISNGAIKADEGQDSAAPTLAPMTLKSTIPDTPVQTVPEPVRSTSGRTYIRGSRGGGCYYINSNGNKTYVDRNLCN